MAAVRGSMQREIRRWEAHGKGSIPAGRGRERIMVWKQQGKNKHTQRKYNTNINKQWEWKKLKPKKTNQIYMNTLFWGKDIRQRATEAKDKKENAKTEQNTF